MTLNATTMSVMLNNLTTGATYNIRVVAYTRIGAGPFSQPVSCSWTLCGDGDIMVLLCMYFLHNDANFSKGKSCTRSTIIKLHDSAFIQIMLIIWFPFSFLSFTSHMVICRTTDSINNGSKPFGYTATCTSIRFGRLGRSPSAQTNATPFTWTMVHRVDIGHCITIFIARNSWHNIFPTSS